MSNSTNGESPSPTSSPQVDLITEQVYKQLRDPVFRAAVNLAADFKCLKAIQSGRLRATGISKLPEPIRYIPRMDLVDDPSSSRYSAVFEIPGINKNSIALGIRSGKLFISGRRHAPYLKPTKLEVASTKAIQADGDSPLDDVPQRNLRIPVREMRYGSYERYVDIPAGIKESDIKAVLMDGLLTVTWPKTSPSQFSLAPEPDLIKPAKSKSSSPSSHPKALLAVGTAAQ